MSSDIFVIAQPNIADFEDTDVDVLIDHRLFGFDGWCTAHCTVSSNQAVMACTVCGYSVVQRRAGKHFDPTAPHPRNVPRYTASMGTAWHVVEAMKQRDTATRILFELRLNALDHCRIVDLTPRMIAEAALQAIGCVDQAGYIIARSEGAQ